MDDLTGKQYHRLTVIKAAARKGYWICECKCGSRKEIYGGNLRSGRTKSCGCLNREKVIGRNTKHGFTSGEERDPLYAVWANMRRRCNDDHNKWYQRYGGRGIKVCKEWADDFDVFHSWAMDNGYKTGLTIDRIDNDGDYSPQNCRWASAKEQARNRSTNHKITAFGKTMLLSDWSIETGIKITTILERIRRGWSPEQAVSRVPNHT